MKCFRLDVKKSTFIQFYSSISQKLLENALDWTSTFCTISDEQRKTIFHVRQNFLYKYGEPWVKKGDTNFDVPMGVYDSAEVCDIVGLYLLHQLKHLGLKIGLYRDDGLALSDKTQGFYYRIESNFVSDCTNVFIVT